MPRKRENNVFRFKQFNVSHSHSTMKVGTDGVLVGAWADVTDARRVLDVGCGCGLIALMVAQRACEAIVDAIDIDPASVEEARANFAASPWADRLRASVADFNSYNGGPYDLIVANPPFFNNSLLPPDEARRHARHTDTLSLHDLVTNAARMMSHTARLSLITPPDTLDEILFAASLAGLSLTRRCLVIPVEGAEPKRVLTELRPHGVSTDCEHSTLTLDTDTVPRRRTPQYTALTRDFYIR